MKKIFVLLLFFPLFSCNDWLTVESEKSVTYINYFKSEQDLEKVLISIFGCEKGIFAGINHLNIVGLSCDWGGDYEGLRNLDPKEFFSGMDSWVLHYNVFYLANMLEENRYRFENVSKERADYWIAQANFAKALSYFDLIRRWGEAPLAPGTESTEPVGKSSTMTLCEEAIRCANIALTLPPYEQLTDANGKTVTSKQFASLGTVHTLLANIYAWMGGLYGDRKYWEEAEKHASLVIDGKAGFYDLEKDILSMKNNTLGPVRRSVETIFSIEINEQDENRFWSGVFEYRYPGLLLLDYPYVASTPESIESSSRMPTIRVESVKALYHERDDQRIKEYWYNLGEVGYWEKYMDDEGVVTDSTWILSEYAFIDKWNEEIRSVNPQFIEEEGARLLAMDGNRVVWRLADLILLRAECRVRLGLETAVNDLNRIRNRSGLTDYDGPTDPELLRREIFHERERELFGEGQRYFDVVRNGYFREEFSWAYAGLSDQDVKNGALYLPVSKNSFEKNTLMKQNIYWLWRQQ
ncbi:RagB/SusD family nutrient uptake outer membrane protein [Gabonibacter chumensis]|uniref:RagB/SusD family nutrient uptake outer membrane protein n=1 Tax=Gabonibacter chumensis TaxID=2972474 RepID=UPI00257333FE|nr:RagB/SusD family nutrient uptake outer membrane protein [Gabonibacter chumensis]MCR9011405.1 RagB/SusD family nutrient uptake outer membrane protein [Gabonibacter chumensis]